MLKHELIKAVSSQTGHSQDTVRSILESVRANVLAAIRSGQAAFLFGLGKISVNKRPEKVARNIHSGERVIVRADAPTFGSA